MNVWNIFSHKVRKKIFVFTVKENQFEKQCAIEWNLQNLWRHGTHCVVFPGLCHSNSEEHPRILESADFKEDWCWRAEQVSHCHVQGPSTATWCWRWDHWHSYENTAYVSGGKYNVPLHQKTSKTKMSACGGVQIVEPNGLLNTFLCVLNVSKSIT